MSISEELSVSVEILRSQWLSGMLTVFHPLSPPEPFVSEGELTPNETTPTAVSFCESVSCLSQAVNSRPYSVNRNVPMKILCCIKNIINITLPFQDDVFYL